MVNSRTRIDLPRQWLIAELGLHLVDHKGILGVAIRQVARVMHGSFLVRHAQHHIRADLEGTSSLPTDS